MTYGHPSASQEICCECCLKYYWGYVARALGKVDLRSSNQYPHCKIFGGLFILAAEGSIRAGGILPVLECARPLLKLEFIDEKALCILVSRGWGGGGAAIDQ